MLQNIPNLRRKSPPLTCKTYVYTALRAASGRAIIKIEAVQCSLDLELIHFHDVCVMLVHSTKSTFSMPHSIKSLVQ